eukprot:14564110-Alexandrium_andersonii.AAC.1
MPPDGTPHRDEPAAPRERQQPRQRNSDRGNYYRLMRRQQDDLGRRRALFCTEQWWERQALLAFT